MLIYLNFETKRIDKDNLGLSILLSGVKYDQ